MNSFLYSLLINIILMGIIWSMTALPGYSRIYPVHYTSISLLIILISLYTVYSLIRFINTESQVQAQSRIEAAYMDQIEAYLKAEEQEENLRRLRHDLINYTQSTGFIDLESDPKKTH